MARRRLPDGVDWITGGSSGIGRALALRMASAGRRVVVSSPDTAGLERVERDARGLPGAVVPLPLDVTDAVACEQAVAQIEREHGALAVAVLNAGIYRPDGPAGFDLEIFEQTVEVNLLGVGRALAPALAAMRGRGQGQVALTGSVISYRGWPSAAAYGATKAALVNLAEGMAGTLAAQGIKLQVINPGFVQTPLLDAVRIRPPHMISPEAAAEKIWDGLQSNQFEIAFPWPMIWQTSLMRRLPNRVALSLIGWGAKRGLGRFRPAARSAARRCGRCGSRPRSRPGSRSTSA